MLTRIWRFALPKAAGLLAFLGLLLLSPAAAGQGETPQVILLNADGVLTPAMAEYIERGLSTAQQEGAEAVILQLNTPGGSVGLMNRIVQNIRASEVPVIVYVAPPGAMAGSAGTLITLAGDLAAMAPETTIGAASPVGPAGEDLEDTMAAKEQNMLKATVRTLAERRPSTAIRLAEETIETARAVSAMEALQVGLVDFVADDLDELLSDLDGQRLMKGNEERVLDTVPAEVVELPPNLLEQVLDALTDPNIVFLLINFGAAAVLIEIASPGGWVAGAIGIACLALATYGLGILPVNWFGVIFLVLAFILFILDVQTPTHGGLTIAGIASLIAGALILFNSPGAPSFQRVSVPLVIASSLITGGMFFAVVLYAFRTRNAPVLTGKESLAGKVGIVRSLMAPLGVVQLAGEQWTAELTDENQRAEKGDRVRVVRVQGIKLWVEKVD